MKKLIMILMIVLTYTGISQTSGWNSRTTDVQLLYDGSIALSAYDGTTSDSIFTYVDVPGLDCDSVCFIYVTTSPLDGTDRDSTSVTIKAQYFSPGREAAYTDAWGSHNSIITSAYSSTTTGYDGDAVVMEETLHLPTAYLAGRLHIQHKNYRITASTVYFKIWMIRKWINY